MNWYILALLAALSALLVACGGGDGSSGSPTPSGSTVAPTATLTPLQQSLASVVLQPADLPEGLDSGAPDFSTNEDLAGSDLEMLDHLVQVGRQLGVDVQYIPTDRLDPSSPLRGGLQSAASAYVSEIGASETFRETADLARANDWEANYPDIPDLHVIEVEHKIGDESLWLRITGVAECTFVVTPTPDVNGVVPSQVCEQTKLLITDRVVFRSGRVRGYLEVTTLFLPQAPLDSYVTQVKAWADIVAQRATTAFPS
jgi:hypothetical protein